MGFSRTSVNRFSVLGCRGPFRVWCCGSVKFGVVILLEDGYEFVQGRLFGQFRIAFGAKSFTLKPQRYFVSGAQLNLLQSLAEPTPAYLNYPNSNSSLTYAVNTPFSRSQTQPCVCQGPDLGGAGAGVMSDFQFLEFRDFSSMPYTPMPEALRRFLYLAACSAEPPIKLSGMFSRPCLQFQLGP